MLGIIFQFLFGLYFYLSSMEANVLGNIIMIVFGLVFMIPAALGLLPLLLLFFEKTRRVGAYVSIVFGIAGILSEVGIVVGLSLISAGLFYFWKER